MKDTDIIPGSSYKYLTAIEVSKVKRRRIYKWYFIFVAKGSPFATAYFCRNLLPKDLIVEKLITYERPLITE